MYNMGAHVYVALGALFSSIREYLVSMHAEALDNDLDYSYIVT